MHPKSITYNLKIRSGFTFIEMLLVLGIVAILISISSIVLVRPQTQSLLDGEILKIFAEIKNQQIKAMVGDTEGGATPQAYGINIQANQYTLFRGPAYNLADTNNFVVAFPDTIQVINNTLPSGTVVFNRRSGEVSGFISPVAFTLQDTINLNTKTVTLQNIFGSLVITP